jgi:hypothetical protein
MTTLEFLKYAIGYMLIGFVLAFLLVKDNVIPSKDFRYFIDNNKTVKEMYFYFMPDEYKQYYTDWKQYSTKGNK